MSDNARQAAFRTAVQSGQARGAATPVTATRAQALSGSFRPLQRADNLPDAPSKSKNPEDKDPKDVTEKAKAKDTESFFEKEEKSNEIEVEKAAGDGGDFKPMGGNENGWDANADATTPADNSTGAPKTPSGF